MIIPFSPPDITEAEVQLVVEALTSGWITTGPKTKELEEKISNYCGTKKAACLSSATACLETILRVLGIGEGDEVITTAYTYTASASVISHVGARAVLVDTDKDSFFISAENVKQAVTEKTKAIIIVDYAGVPVNPQPFYSIAEELKSSFKPNSKMQEALGRIAIIADGAHSFGAERGGIKSGALCDFTAFSFHAVKNLTTAEGGAATWKSINGIDDEDIYKQFMLYSLHGQNKDALEKTKKGGWRYDIVFPGYKCNMTDIAAAMGLAQLQRYSKMLKKRRALCEKYDSAFKILENAVPLAHKTEDYVSSCHLYPIRIKGIDEKTRDLIIEKMAEKEIATNVHYIPLPMMTAYKNMGYNIKDFPNTYGVYENEITLPLYSVMTNPMQEYVIKSFVEVVNKLC
ncbi:MAG: DegT/DnrJ/EryC1/StrS aminotransferase family protein [Clostridia bacterium]|nr:DegT/DnrJ/EryC1/StrS aminotransferase family protein [Clostridia bacterium]